MKKIIYAIIIFLAGLSVRGQKKVMHLETQDIIIQGEATDSAVLANPNRTLGLKLHISTFASNLTVAPKVIIDHKIGNHLPFKNVIRANTEFNYVTFSLEWVWEGNKVLTFPWSDAYNTYIIEKGDSIYCKLSNKQYKFAGKGAEKLNCQSDIYKLRYTADNLIPLKDKRYEEYYSNIDKKMDSILFLQLNIVEQYSPKIGKRMTSIMIANCYGMRYWGLLRGNVNKSRTDTAAFKAFLKSEAYKKINLNLDEKFDEQDIVSSPVYCDAVFEKIVNENLVDKSGNIMRIESAKVSELVFNSIKKKYNGIQRDKLITLFFLRFKNADLDYLNQSISLINDREYKEILLKIKNTKTKGVPFFQFELEDTRNNLIKLSDLDDKVIILDFWYTGCENCIFLHEGMSSIVEKYKNNPKVEFVSICIDKNKDQWLKSVASGKYTDPEGLNLYTNGLGYHHPVIEANNITGYPTMYILKNGKMFSSTPPKPAPGSNDRTNSVRAELISLIEEALRDELP